MNVFSGFFKKKNYGISLATYFKNQVAMKM